MLLEAEANHKRAVLAAEQKLAAARETLDQLRAPQGGDLRPRKLAYREDLEQMIREASGQIVPLPMTPHAQLITKAVARRRPFDAKGDGYRDALVWETVKGLLDAHPDPVVLVSNDHAAFSASKERARLAGDLVRELRDAGHSGRVALYFEIADFTGQLPEARNLVEEWSEILVADPSFTSALMSFLVQLARTDADYAIGESNITVPAREARFLSFSDPRDLRLAEVWVGDDGRALLNVFATFDYVQEYQTPLPVPGPTGPTTPTFWSAVTAQGPITLGFEVFQRNRADPTQLAGHIVEWADPGTGRSGSV